MIDPHLLGRDRHLVAPCPRCYGRTVRIACPVLGTLDENYEGTVSDVYECPTCHEVVRMPCPVGEGQ